MVKRSKIGIYKPKTYMPLQAEFNFTKPSSTKQALSNPLWKAVMQDEFNALI